MPTIAASPLSRIWLTSSAVRIPPTANTGMETSCEIAENKCRFHTGLNGARLPPYQAPSLRKARLRRVGAAFFSRLIMPAFVQIPSGTPPRHSVVSGNADTSHGVSASKPHSSSSGASRNASS